jgi:hypothetical protein
LDPEHERRVARLQNADEVVCDAEKRAYPGSWTPPELTALASLRDHQARQWDDLAADLEDRADSRDQEAQRADITGSASGRRARDLTSDQDPGWADRLAAAGHRDDAAGARGDSREDRKAASDSRRRAAAHRERAAEERLAALEVAEMARRTIDQLRDGLDTRLIVAQAAGLLMSRHSLTYAAAFDMIATMSEQTKDTLHDVAARLVDEHVAGLAHDEPVVLPSRDASIFRADI